MATYDVGDQRRLKATFTDIDGAAADTTTVTFKITAPDGTTTTYVFGTDAEAVKESTGVYYVDWTITQSGEHRWKWTGTGNAAAAGESSFDVAQSQII